MTEAEINELVMGRLIDAYYLGIKAVCDRLVADGAISQYKADMLIKHGAEWADDGLVNAQ